MILGVGLVCTFTFHTFLFQQKIHETVDIKRNVMMVSHPKGTHNLKDSELGKKSHARGNRDNCYP